MNDEHPPCANPGCGRPVTRRPTDSNQTYARRRTCSVKCARQLGNINRDYDTTSRLAATRTCSAPGCGKPLVQGRRESNARFLSRSTCGTRACVQAATHAAHNTEPATSYDERKARMTPLQRRAYADLAWCIGWTRQYRIEEARAYEVVDEALRIASGRQLVEEVGA